MTKTATGKMPPTSLTETLLEAAQRIHDKYGPRLGWSELLQLAQDRECVPYPCEIRFDVGPLLPGESAHAVPKGPQPESGFIICLHPVYASQLERAPHLVLYQLALVQTGNRACPEAAETFGAHALGLPRQEYYQALCQLATQLGEVEVA
jgi:hypothetical protein